MSIKVRPYHKPVIALLMTYLLTTGIERHRSGRSTNGPEWKNYFTESSWEGSQKAIPTLQELTSSDWQAESQTAINVVLDNSEEKSETGGWAN